MSYHCSRYPNFQQNYKYLKETKQKNLDGPGKLTKALGITMSDNGKDLCQCNEFMIKKGIIISEDQITQSPRIGITKGLDKLWRFSIKK